MYQLSMVMTGGWFDIVIPILVAFSVPCDGTGVFIDFMVTSMLCIALTGCFVRWMLQSQVVSDSFF